MATKLCISSQRLIVGVWATMRSSGGTDAVARADTVTMARGSQVLPVHD